MTNTRVVLVRHGESNVTVQGIVGGPRTCTGLSDLGRQQAERLRDRFMRTREIAADVLISSGYPRAIETAQIVAPALGSLPLHVDSNWGEHDPGPECDGLTYAEFVKRFGEPYWEGDPHDVTFPGGETVAEFQLRIGSALFALVEKHAGKNIVVFCHGGVVDAVLRKALQAPPVGAFDIYTHNTSLTEVVNLERNKWRLHRYNDVAHLAGLPPRTPVTHNV